MKVFDWFVLFFVLGHVAIEMLGDDRPYTLVLEMMPSNQVIGNDAQIDL